MFDFSVYDASESASAFFQRVDTPYNVPIVFLANTAIFIIINYSARLGSNRGPVTKSGENADEGDDEQSAMSSSNSELRGVNVPHRSHLPGSLDAWSELVASSQYQHVSSTSKAEISPWALLADFFAKKGGLQLLLPRLGTLNIRGKKASSSTASTLTEAPSIQTGYTATAAKGLAYYARNTQGKEVVIRLVKCHSEGKQHLRILRHMQKNTRPFNVNHNGSITRHAPYVATSPDMHILEHAHILPLDSELTFHDLVFGIFPRINTTLEHVLGENVTESSLSIGDTLDILIQALEAIVYIHSERIAHQSLFLSNFLLEWHSTAASRHSTAKTTPRVYLTEFDKAVIFPGDTRAQDMRVPKRSKPSHPEGCPIAPELQDDAAESDEDSEADGEDDDDSDEQANSYCPFTTDVWQFGHSVSAIDCGIPEVSSVFEAMSRSSTSHRIFAIEALERLQKVMASQGPDVLTQSLPPRFSSER